MKRALLTAPLLLLLACATEPRPVFPPPPPPVLAAPPPPVASAAPVVRETPDAPFRSVAPEPGPPVTFVPPKISELHLKNGVRVLFVERHDLPIVSLRIVAAAGAGDLPWEPPGAASMMGAMLEQGTTSASALQISDAYESLGAHHGAWVDWDSGGVAVKVTTEKLAAALAILADVVMHPTFPDEELTRLRARRLAALQQEKSSPPAMGANAMAAALYGRGHPYGHSLSGQRADIEKVDRADLVRAHAVLFNPKTAAIVVAGDVTRETLLAKLEATLGSWETPAPSGALARATTPGTPAVKEAARVVLVDRPGAPQSGVRLVEVGVARGAPDHDAVVVMNEIFGGMFSSRINMNLRETHAYTYGASSYFDMRQGPGPFVATASVKTDTTAAAITELFKEERAMQADLVSPEELSAAKASIALALPAHFESVDSVTHALADIVVYRLPLDEYAIRLARIEKVTAEDVRRAARAHLHPRTSRVVIVGDRAKVEPTLDPLHLGPVEVRDAYGDVVPALSSSPSPSHS